MRELTLFMHVSLDGFVAGPNGEMDWITVTEDVFAYAGQRTDNADTALYGRKTYEMMNGYWPTAGEQPNASAHDLQHSAWYNRVNKVVVSRSLRGTSIPNTTIVGDDLPREIGAIKRGEGREILIFGSASAAHALMAHDLIDNFWLFVNPVLLGNGLPLFSGLSERKALKSVASTRLPSGVVCLQFRNEQGA